MQSQWNMGHVAVDNIVVARLDVTDVKMHVSQLQLTRANLPFAATALLKAYHDLLNKTPNAMPQEVNDWCS